MDNEKTFLQVDDSMVVPIDGFHHDQGKSDEKERSIKVERFVDRQFCSSEKLLQEFLFSFHFYGEKEREMKIRKGERENDVHGENIENAVNLIGNETKIGFLSSATCIFTEGLQITKAKQEQFNIMNG